MPQDGNSDDFRHDLIIASDDGTVLDIPRECWDQDAYRVGRAGFESDDWKVVRELLQCGVLLAAVPPKLPLDKPRPVRHLLACEHRRPEEVYAVPRSVTSEAVRLEIWSPLFASFPDGDAGQNGSFLARNRSFAHRRHQWP